jgi:hypothetical protein
VSTEKKHAEFTERTEPSDRLLYSKRITVCTTCGWETTATNGSLYGGPRRARVVMADQGQAVEPRENERWRVGRRVGRTIYRQLGPNPSDDDPLIGVMDTPAFARAVVDAAARLDAVTAERDEAVKRMRCQHCVPAPEADERSFMCTDCAVAADTEVQELRDEVERLNALMHNHETCCRRSQALTAERDALKEALGRISTLTDGMAYDVLDHANALRWAKRIAADALAALSPVQEREGNQHGE